jgi:hypothetical protein
VTYIQTKWKGQPCTNNLTKKLNIKEECMNDLQTYLIQNSLSTKQKEREKKASTKKIQS